MVLTNSVINSLDFVVNRFFVKLFKTGDMNVIKCCQHELPSVKLIPVRCGKKFLVQYLVRQCLLQIFVKIVFCHVWSSSVLAFYIDICV